MIKVMIKKAITLFGMLVLMLPMVAAAKYSLNNLQNLNLAPEQQQQVSLINQKYSSKHKSLTNTLKSKQKYLNQLLLDESSSDQKISELKREIRNLQAQFADIEVKYWLEIKKNLSTQQKAQLRKKYIH